MDNIFGNPITREKRSEIMSKIRSSNTKLELRVFEHLEGRGVKFQKHHKMLGKPDIVLLDEKIAIFLDSDFWHGWRFATWSYKLKPFWYDKISTNIKRDKRIRRKLRAEGWRTIRIWEHQLKKNFIMQMSKVIRILNEITPLEK